MNCYLTFLFVAKLSDIKIYKIHLCINHRSFLQHNIRFELWHCLSFVVNLLPLEKVQEIDRSGPGVQAVGQFRPASEDKCQSQCQRIGSREHGEDAGHGE